MVIFFSSTLNLLLLTGIYYLSYFHMCESGSVFGIRIRIHKVHEYGTNPIWIWIHKPGLRSNPAGQVPPLKNSGPIARVFWHLLY